MANLKVINFATGEAGAAVKLPKEVFGIEANNQVIFDAVLVARTNSRQDSSKTKKRDEVRGGGRKPWRQKGTGRARQGSIRSPQWKGGGIVFGPTGDQNHFIKQNKKERVLAIKSALSQKAKDAELVVINALDLKEIKTKTAKLALEKSNLLEKTLFVVTEDSITTQSWLSLVNIPTVAITYADELNVYDILNSKNLVLTESSLKFLSEVLANG